MREAGALARGTHKSAPSASTAATRARMVRAVVAIRACIAIVAAPSSSVEMPSMPTRQASTTIKCCLLLLKLLSADMPVSMAILASDGEDVVPDDS